MHLSLSVKMPTDDHRIAIGVFTEILPGSLLKHPVDMPRQKITGGLWCLHAAGSGSRLLEDRKPLGPRGGVGLSLRTDPILDS